MSREVLEIVATEIDSEWRAKGGLNCTEVCAIVRSHISDTCPDCGRQKAQSVSDIIEGLCPKWYAINDAMAEEDCFRSTQGWPNGARYRWGDRVTKIKGSSWTGRICGVYSSTMTLIGYAVESENEPGSVQIYPEAALMLKESG